MLCMNIRTLIILLLLNVSAFAQEKVLIKGFLEQSFSRAEVEKSYIDTIEYKKRGFKESVKEKKMWTPWSKDEIKKNKEAYGQLSNRYILNGSYDDIISDSAWCSNQTVMVNTFPHKVQILLAEMEERYSFVGAKLKAKFYTKPSDDFYLYRLYYFEGYAIRYVYTWEELKQNTYFENDNYDVLANICDETEPIEVYYMYTSHRFEPVEVPTDYHNEYEDKELLLQKRRQRYE